MPAVLQNQPVKKSLTTMVATNRAAALKNSDSAADTEASRGLVSIEVDDSRAEIFADGSFVGNAPAILSMAEGVHSIEIKSCGSVGYRRQIAVNAGAKLRVCAVLHKENVQGKLIRPAGWQPA